MNRLTDDRLLQIGAMIDTIDVDAEAHNRGEWKLAALDLYGEVERLRHPRSSYPAVRSVDCSHSRANSGDRFCCSCGISLALPACKFSINLTKNDRSRGYVDLSAAEVKLPLCIDCGAEIEGMSYFEDEDVCQTCGPKHDADNERIAAALSRDDYPELDAKDGDVKPMGPQEDGFGRTWYYSVDHDLHGASHIEYFWRLAGDEMTTLHARAEIVRTKRNSILGWQDEFVIPVPDQLRTSVIRMLRQDPDRRRQMRAFRFRDLRPDEYIGIAPPMAEVDRIELEKEG